MQPHIDHWCCRFGCDHAVFRYWSSNIFIWIAVRRRLLSFIVVRDYFSAYSFKGPYFQKPFMRQLPTRYWAPAWHKNGKLCTIFHRGETRKLYSRNWNRLSQRSTCFVEGNRCRLKIENKGALLKEILKGLLSKTKFSTGVNVLRSLTFEKHYKYHTLGDHEGRDAVTKLKYSVNTCPASSLHFIRNSAPMVISSNPDTRCHHQVLRRSQ